MCEPSRTVLDRAFDGGPGRLIVPHRGAIVTRLSLEDLKEIYLIRQQLEPLAALKAAENATEEELRGIDAVLAEQAPAHLDWWLAWAC